MIDSDPVWKARLTLPAWTTLLLALASFGGCSPESNDESAQPRDPSSPIVVDDHGEKPREPSSPKDVTPDDEKPVAPERSGEAVAKPAEEPKVRAVETPDEKPRIEAPTQPSAADPSSTGNAEKPVPEMVQDSPRAKDTPSDLTRPGQPAPPKKPTLPAHLVDKLHEPLVVMSKAHEASCLVKVGDQMPEITPTDMQGEEHILSSLYGQTLTVVVLWSRRQALGREQFQRLGKETWRPFRESGVNVIAVNTGDAIEDVRDLIGEADAAFPCLLDGEGNAMAALATGKLPRTYLLDAKGKILWLDIEYSCSSRRELENALYFFLLREDG
ncbi:MAG: redoxin domain-containing protein [Pirellulaceae bacterium]